MQLLKKEENFLRSSFNQNFILYKISNEKKLYSSLMRGFTLNSFFMYNEKRLNILWNLCSVT